MAMNLSGGGARRGQRRARRAAMSEINVTPFVDVMLVLLIIFMVTAPLLKTGVPVDLPEARANALPEEQAGITVTLSGDGAIFLDDEELASGELSARLAEVRPAPGGSLPPVSLRADRALDYGRVMAILGELNRAGFTAISLVTTSGPAPLQTATGTGVSTGSETGQ